MADESQIVQWLRDDPTVATFVAGRIYAELRTERDQLPAVSVELAVGTPANVLGGNPGVDRRLLLITCSSKNRSEARRLSEAARRCLEPRGTLLAEGPVAYDEDLKSWDVQLEFSFWQRR